MDEAKSQSCTEVKYCEHVHLRVFESKFQSIQCSVKVIFEILGRRI